MTRIVTSRDLDEALRALGARLLPAIRAAAVGFLEAYRDVLTPYPPASEANRPNARGRWYERGYGPRWIRRDGSIGGRKTSELLGRSWSTQPTTGGARLVSRASYSGAVHRDPRSSRRPRQAAYHGRRGWVTTAQAYDQVQARRLWPRLIATACRKALGR